MTAKGQRMPVRASLEGDAVQTFISFPTDPSSEDYAVGDRASGETHGVVHTKAHIVALILDLVRYVPTKPLNRMRALEPSCGEGAFLREIVRRLCASAPDVDSEALELREAVRAYDIDPVHVEQSREVVKEELTRAGFAPRLAQELAAHWVRHDDFLLAELGGDFDCVVGNPPYVRIEQIADRLQSEYRRRYRSLFDRADLYVAFIERALQALKQEGRLSFICADRWTTNKYGKVLRSIVTSRFAMDVYIDMHKASPFESEVIAYPSVFVIRNGKQEAVRVQRMATADDAECAAFLRTESPEAYPSWFQGEEPWVLSSPSQFKILRDLEQRFEPLEKKGVTRVGIGVATGNDSVFIVDSDLDVEADRLVPLVMRRDIDAGRISWGGRAVINAFGPDGKVVDLSAYPKLGRYLETHAGEIRKRHVSRKNPHAWFRTIDRVYPELVAKPKLLIPDIAGSNQVAFDSGEFHPHHNLYFITSEEWDLEVLGGLLSSRVALFFIWSYATKMRGGYLRFQAQYLRRIRVPAFSALPTSLRKRLRNAFRKRDFAALDRLGLEAYGLDALPEFDFVDTRT